VSNLDLDLAAIPPEAEGAFCIGGDGTLIRAALSVVERELPLIGVNRGHVGYLCELDHRSVFEAIDKLMEDQFTIENRILLEGYCIKSGITTPSHLALNDVVIHRSSQPEMVSLIIHVNGEYLSHFSADGIVIATPTGSTGYSMAAGGPIVDPKAELVLLTPINSQALNSKSIVLEAGHEIIVKIGTRHRKPNEKAEVSFDGDPFTHLSVGDKIVIRRANARIPIIKIKKLSFVEMLRKKMR
jgi:NAD+ kinase